MTKNEKGYRRGHKVIPATSVKKEVWEKVFKKSKAGVEHFSYKRVLVTH